MESLIYRADQGEDIILGTEDRIEELEQMANKNDELI